MVMASNACPDCGGRLVTERDDYRLRSSLDVLLLDIEIRRCRGCRYSEAVIPNQDGLYRALALGVVSKPTRLAPNEIRFLRKYLDWTGREMAARFGVSPETVSRWESGERPMSMHPAADRLLRALVANRQRRRLRDAQLADIGDSAESAHLRARLGAGAIWLAEAA